MKRLFYALVLLLIASPLMAAQQTILGGSGVLWGDEKTKINSNFSELYGKLAQALLTTSSPTFADLTLTSDLNLKDWIYFTSDDDTHYVAVAAGNNTANYILRWPTAAAGGSNYLLNFDADGTGGWTDPSTLGGDDLGSATSSSVIALFGSGSCSGYLKSDGTCDTPSGAAHDAVTLDTETAAIFSLNSQQITLDSQTANYFLAAPNGSAGDPSFRAIADADIPSAIARDSEIPTASSLSVDDLITLSGVATGAVNLGSFTGTSIADNLTIKAAFQDLETDLEALPTLTWGTGLTDTSNTISVTYPVTAEVFGAGWDSDGNGATKNDVYDALAGYQASDSDLTDLADGALTASKVSGSKVTTASKSANYTIGTDSADEAYGGTIYVTSAATITAPAVTAGMNFTVVTIGSIAVSLDVNASDRMILDGTALADGDKATNTSTAGDTITCQYQSADGWFCWSGTMHATTKHWTDGN